MDEYPINHDSLLHELETYSDVAGMKILHVDTAATGRWYQHLNGELVVLGDGIGFTCNNNDLSDRFEAWPNDKTHDDVFSHQMADWLEDVSCEETLNESMSVAFPVTVQDGTQEGESTMDDVLGDDDEALADPVEVGIREEMDLDTVDISGLPMKEQGRRKAWRSLPQRVRIGVRRLHRQFGHVPIKVMTNMLRAAKVDPSYIKAAQLHRCAVCENTAPRKATHKTTIPPEYKFNHTLGIDLFEISDPQGKTYCVMNMVLVGTTFQLCHVIREGKGQCSSTQALQVLKNRWFSLGRPPITVSL